MPGINNAYWSADGYSIITECEYGLQTTIWSLIDSQKFIITNPKSDIWTPTSSATTTGITTNSISNNKDSLSYTSTNTTTWRPKLTTFTDDANRNLLLFVHRYDIKDYIGIYKPNPWEEIHKFICRTHDVSYIDWIKGRNLIVTIDSPSTYNVALYTPSGEVRWS